MPHVIIVRIIIIKYDFWETEYLCSYSFDNPLLHNVLYSVVYRFTVANNNYNYNHNNNSKNNTATTISEYRSA